MLGAMPDNRRIAIIVTIALLVSSGVVLSSSASGGSAVFLAKPLRIPLAEAIIPSTIAVNPAKIIEPNSPARMSNVGPEPIMQAVGFGFGLPAPVTTVEPATSMSELLATSAVGYAIAASSDQVISGMQEAGPVFFQGIGTVSTSGQSVTLTTSPEGTLVVVSTGNTIFFALFAQPNQIFKTSSGMNELGSNTQLSYSGLSAVTAAIPGLWLDSSKRRTRSQIYIEILEVMKRGPMTPFEIAFYARLNHKRTKKYTEFLTSTGYLEAHEEDGKMIYVLTQDGKGFLDQAKSLFENQRGELPDIQHRGFSVW